MYPAQQNATDQTANFFWLIVMIIGALLIFWWLERQWLIIPLYHLRYYELTVVRYCVEGWNAISGFLHLPKGNVNTVIKTQQYLLSAPPKTESFSNFQVVNNYVGGWLRYPMAVVLLGLAALLYFKMGNKKFTKTYSMQTLKDAEIDNWPQIRPVATTDLIKEDIEVGPWAMAKQPLPFCQEHNMVTPMEKDQRLVWKLDKSIAYRALTVQLGPIFTSVDKLPIHMKALIVVCISRAIREREIGNRILRQIASSASSGKLNFAGVAEQLEKYKSHKILKWVATRHAYVYTVMATLLEIARADGVLASAEFLWLKPLDRRLWYVLNSVGRQTAVVEVAGAFAHWKAEKKLGRALRTPMVKEGVNALAEAMEDTLFIPEGDSWRTFKEA